MQIEQSVLMYLGKQPYKRNEKKNCKLLNDFMTGFQSEVQERTLFITYSGRKGKFF